MFIAYPIYLLTRQLFILSATHKARHPEKEQSFQRYPRWPPGPPWHTCHRNKEATPRSPRTTKSKTSAHLCSCCRDASSRWSRCRPRASRRYPGRGSRAPCRRASPSRPPAPLCRPRSPRKQYPAGWRLPAGRSAAKPVRNFDLAVGETFGGMLLFWGGVYPSPLLGKLLLPSRGEHCREVRNASLAGIIARVQRVLCTL